jgi:hypothetical protein
MTSVAANEMQRQAPQDRKIAAEAIVEQAYPNGAVAHAPMSTAAIASHRQPDACPDQIEGAQVCDADPGQDQERSSNRPEVINRRGPWRSSHAPSGDAAAPEISSAREYASVSWVRDQSSSRCIESRKTEKAQ